MNQLPNKINKFHRSDRISVLLIGCGGNGSNLLTELGRINSNMVLLGKPGMHVTVFDDDTVENFNVGRQKFSYHDKGRHKAEVLIERVNRFYNTDWQYRTEKYIGEYQHNIIITCTDNVESRKRIREYFIKNKVYDKRIGNQERFPIAWIDLGNGQNNGNILIKILEKYKKNGTKDIFDYNPRIKTPARRISCSMEEALEHQSAYINPLVALTASKLIYDLFMKKEIEHIGAFVDSERFKVNLIKYNHEPKV